MVGQDRTALRLRLAARIIGFGNVSFVMSFLIGETCTEYLTRGWEALSLEGALVGMMAGLALAGCIVSWWREHLAGILLIVSSFLCAINIPPLPPLIPNDVSG